MGWLIVCLLALLLTGHWLIASLLIAIYFYTQRRSVPLPDNTEKLSDPRVQRTLRGTASISAERNRTDLLVLRLELGRLLAAGKIDRALYEQTIAGIDTLSTEVLAREDIAPKNEQWRRRREAAWELLLQRRLVPLSLPPWHEEEQAEQERTKKARQEHAAQHRAEVPPLAPESLVLLRKPVSVPPLPAESSTQPALSQASPVVSLSVESPLQEKESPLPPTAIASQEDTEEYAWKPSVPNALERALQTVSGWPALIAPFLVQNIGWFIGGFCFVAGSIFLVSYTTGFTKALTVSAVLFTYTLSILWAGYQLRRRHPELETSSSVLLTLGVLLVPLNIASSVRLIETGQHFPWLMIGIPVTALSMGGLYFATMLVSGVMDRSLQGRHPQIFLALAAMQLAVPVLTQIPSWPLLAGLHLILLGFLAYGLRLFTQDWLHSIFVERRKTAYYAAGTLVYSAVVSFVHLTWGYKHPLALPHGYYSPFLMALCGLLFYVDAQLKQWTRQYTFLSRFSFALYGLSILALLLSADAGVARLLTLFLAIGLYSMVVWQYLTLPPLYLLLACLGWLYSLLILQGLPNQWHLLASVPGLAGLFAASRWLQHRQSTALAVMCYRVWLGMALALTGWSLLHAQPGLVAMSTAVVMMAGAFYGLQFAPAGLFGGTDDTASAVDFRNGPWLYAVTLIGSIVVAYAPLWTGLSWAAQCAFGLTLLALLWNALGLHLRRTVSTAAVAKAEVLLNSTLLNLGLSFILTVMLALPGLTQNRALPMLLTMIGGALLWMSLALRVGWLFYGVLGLWGAAGVIFKLTYFPAQSTGALEMLLALAMWALLWWLEHEPDEVTTLRREQTQLQAARQPPLTLLWQFPVSGDRLHRDILRVPLQQSMMLLWAIGMRHIGARLLEGKLGWGWVLSTSLGAGGALLGAGHFRLPSLLPLSFLLGLGACLTVAFKLGISTIAGLCLVGVLYAFLIWSLSVFLLAHPATAKVATLLHLGGSRTLAEQEVHWTAFAVTLLCVVLSLESYGLFTPSVVLLLALAISMVFFWSAGQRYQQRLHSYTLLSIGVLGTLLCYSWVFPPLPSPTVARWYGLLGDHGLGFTFTLLSLFLWAIAWQLTRSMTDPEAERVTFSHSLYRKPLRMVAAVLALVVIAQQLGLAALSWAGTASTMSFAVLGVLFLAGVSLLLANHALGEPVFSLIGILCTVLAVFWAQGIWFHSPTAFIPQLGALAYTDQWLTLAVLSLGLACLTYYVERFHGLPSLLGARPSWSHFFDYTGETFTPVKIYIRPLQVAAVLTYSWALLGALALFVQGPSQTDSLLPLVFLTLTIHSVLLLRSSSWVGFPWLAGLTLTGAGLSFNAVWVQFFQPWVGHTWLGPSVPATLILANLVWANLLLRLVLLWRQHGESLSTRWGWRNHNLAAPLLFWPAALLFTQLLQLVLFEIVPLLFSHSTSTSIFHTSQTLVGILLTFSFIYLVWLHCTSWTTHAALSSLLCTLLTVWLSSFIAPHLPLFLALWSAALLFAHWVWERKQWGDETTLVIRQTLAKWLDPSLIVAITALALIPQVPLGERLATLAVLIGVAASLGWQHQQRGWLLAAMGMFLVLLHSWWLLWVPFRQVFLLLPWYALQMAVLTWLLVWLYDALRRYRAEPVVAISIAPASGEATTVATTKFDILPLLSWVLPVIATLALLEWLLHEFFLFTDLAATGQPQWLITNGDTAAALLASALLLALGIRQLRQSQQAEWVYGTVAFGFAIGVYIRLLVIGLAPVSAWDTAAIMGATYALFVIQRLTHSEPLFHVVMVLPLLTLLTVPLQFASSHAAGTFLTIGTLYLLTHRETNRSLPLYLALLAFNAAVYLWIPGWANRYHMLQVYVVPAAISVLFMLHLHRDELKPSVLNSARLAALSVLYTSATLDVFLRDDLVIFGIMLALSFAGILLGIAWRTRAFLYSGVTFLVLNILGQLVLLFPEQRLGKAIVLLVMGATITGGMIWFNAQREAILQRIRIFRADLETWA